MDAPTITELPGMIGALAASDPTGPVFVSCSNGDNHQATALLGIDTAGRIMWRADFDGRADRLRASADGTAWIAHIGADGHTFTQVGADGSVRRSVVGEHESDERVGAYVLLPDGFCAVWLPADRARTPRVARHDSGGGTVWSTPVGLDRASDPGGGWRLDSTGPPVTVELDHSQPLLISGNRVLVSVNDGRSGVGIGVLLDTVTGAVVAATPPRPHRYKAIAGRERFLIGSQGYGVFSTTLHDGYGEAMRTWPSHGRMVVDRHLAIRSAEYDNRGSARLLYSVLLADGSVRDGPRLPGSNTAHPALDRDGTAVFWSADRLLAVDVELRVRELFVKTTRIDRGLLSRVLLLDRGRVMLTVEDELLVFPHTGLAPLDTGPWACGDGNLGGNPVAYL